MDVNKFALIVYDPKIVPDKRGCLRFSINVHKVLLFDSYSDLRSYEDNYLQTHYHCTKTTLIEELKGE